MTNIIYVTTFWLTEALLYSGIVDPSIINIILKFLTLALLAYFIVPSVEDDHSFCPENSMLLMTSSAPWEARQILYISNHTFLNSYRDLKSV